MADNNGQTNPTAVTVTPVQGTQPNGTTMGTAGAPLAAGARVAMPSTMGRIPTYPTPITPVRRGGGRRR